MKHDFREKPTGNEADQFRSWLERETVDFLQQTRGDAEATKTAIFLYVNPAYEAHMSEEEIGDLFGKCFVRAGHPEEDQDATFDLLEFFAEIAGRTHLDK